MKKILLLVIVIIIAGLVIWRYNVTPTSTNTGSKNETVSVPTTQTVVVSNKVSEYKNEELGFAVRYPTEWERSDASNNITFAVPVDPKVKNSIGRLEAKIDIFSGKCTFPPVTSVKERDTLKVDALSFNMISIANTVQGRNYFNRMYSLEKGPICYLFTFSSIALAPSSKGFVGADIANVSAKNTTLIDAADTQFKDMVKSFKFVVGPAGQDETTASPKK